MSVAPSTSAFPGAAAAVLEPRSENNNHTNSNNSKKKADNSGIPWVTWPNGNPSPHSDVFFTVVCGNSHYHWAMHEGPKFRFVPHTFWKTRVLKDEDIRASPDACIELKVHLPDRASEFMFGVPRWMEENASSVHFATRQHAYEASVSRRMPVATVYVISTNAEHERGLKFLFSQVPCRLFKLRASDFWNLGSYPNIGVDRVAALRGTQSCFGLPALVIDGGTAMTYTAADASGKLMGGNISPGLAWRIKALHRSLAVVGGAPIVDLKDFQEIIDRAKPLNCFSLDPKECAISTMLMDIGYKSYHVVKMWLRKVGPANRNDHEYREEKEEKDDGGTITVERKTENNPQRAVTIVGGDMEIIAQLLETVDGEFHSGIIAPEPGTEPPAEGEFVVEKFRGAIHYGIAQVLFEKVNEQLAQEQPNDLETTRMRMQLLGLRVAMGDSKLDEPRRGTIVSISEGRSVDDDWFLVHHDDASDKNYNLLQIYDGLKHYIEHGEAARIEGGLTVKQREARKAKKDAVQMSVKDLAVTSEKVKAHIASTREESETALEFANKNTAATAGAKETKSPAAPSKKGSTTGDGSSSKKKNGAGSATKKTSVVAGSAKKASTTATSKNKKPEAAAGEQATSATPTTAPNKKKSAAASGSTSKKRPATESTTTPPPVATKKTKTSGAPVTDASNATPLSDSNKKDNVTTPIPEVADTDGNSLVEQRVAKYFGKILYFGTVSEFLPKTDVDDIDLWKIVYDDGDSEEFDPNDMKEARALFLKHADEEPLIVQKKNK